MRRSVDASVADLGNARQIDGLISCREKQLLLAMARLVPRRVVPDQLTAVGMIGAATCSVGLIASGWNLSFLWLALVGLLANWVGDSLDGTLARFRNIERPRYGFFVDHVTDLGSQIMIMIGLGLSPLMRLDVAALALIGYLALSVYTFVKLHVSRSMQLTYFGVGPTEVRLLIACGMLIATVFDIPEFTTPLGVLGLFDMVAAAVAMFAFGSLLTMFVLDARQLALVDPPRTVIPARVDVIEIPQRR